MQEALARELGLAQPEIAWHTERDRIAEAGCFLGLLTGTLAKFATDLKLMMQTEVGEASEPYVANRGSSSTMPQKRNPISCCYIHACAASVRQGVAALLDAMVEDHERATGPWEIEWITLPDVFTLAGGALSQACFVLEGLEVHADQMRANLDMTRGLIVSEAVMMGLAPKLGRDKAHDVLYAICHDPAMGEKSLTDLLLARKDVMAELSEDEIRKLTNPESYLGLSTRHGRSRVAARRLIWRASIKPRQVGAAGQADTFAFEFLGHTHHSRKLHDGRFQCFYAPKAVAVGAQGIGRYEGAVPVVLGPGRRKAVTETVGLLGVDGEHGYAAIHQRLDDRLMRRLDRNGDLV